MPEITRGFQDLIDAYARAEIRVPSLKVITIAQWMLESSRGNSDLATRHSNFSGLKYRDRMADYAVPVEYHAHDGVDMYCDFAGPASFIPGYWHFVESGNYEDPANYANNPRGYIQMLKNHGFAGDPNYVDKVMALEPEAQQRYDESVARQEGVDPPPPPPLTRAMKLAVVIGHNRSAPGAYSPHLAVSEYPFNSEIAAFMQERASEFNIVMQQFFREPGGGYTAEIDRCYAQVNAWDPALVMELHFNAASASANGSEMLYWHTSTPGRQFADHVQRAVVQAYGFTNRGSKPRQSGDRGAYSLVSAAAPAIITEPFFGSNSGDCARIAQAGRPALAEVYLRGARDAGVALGLMEDVVEPPPPPPPSDMLTLTLSRKTVEELVTAGTIALDEGELG